MELRWLETIEENEYSNYNYKYTSTTKNRNLQYRNKPSDEWVNVPWELEEIEK